MNASFGANDDAFSTSLSASGEALIAIGQRIAERVISLRIVRLRLDQLAQLRFHDVVMAGFFGGHRVVVGQIGVVREIRGGLLQACFRFRVALRVEQDRRVGAGDQRLVARIGCLQVGQQLARVVSLALLGEQLRTRDLRRHVLLARGEILFSQSLAAASFFCSSDSCAR